MDAYERLLRALTKGWPEWMPPRKSRNFSDTLPAIVFALRYDDLGDEDELTFERSRERWEAHWKPALEQEHFGDCIKQPCACFRCQAEDCIRVARMIEEGLKA